MYIYNVTVTVEEGIHNEWVQWMKHVHIADVIKTNCFIDSQMVKVLYLEQEGHTYAIQYKFLEMGDIEKYQKEFAPKLQAEHKNKFGDSAVAFRTILQVID
jgi:hypothetical protein